MMELQKPGSRTENKRNATSDKENGEDVTMEEDEVEMSYKELQKWIRDQVEESCLASFGGREYRYYSHLQSLLERRKTQTEKLVSLCKSVSTFEQSVKELYSMLGLEYIGYDINSGCSDDDDALPDWFNSKATSDHDAKRSITVTMKEVKVVLTQLSDAEIKAALHPEPPQIDSNECEYLSSAESEMCWEPEPDSSGSDTSDFTKPAKRRKMDLSRTLVKTHQTSRGTRRQAVISETETPSSDWTSRGAENETMETALEATAATNAKSNVSEASKSQTLQANKTKTVEFNKVNTTLQADKTLEDESRKSETSQADKTTRAESSESKAQQVNKTKIESTKSKTSQADKTTRVESSESKAQQANKTKIESTKSKTSQADKTRDESRKSKTSHVDKTRDESRKSETSQADKTTRVESSESKAQQANKTKIESTKSETSQADKTTRVESSESKAQQANKTKIESTKSKTSQADKTRDEFRKSKTSQADKTRDEFRKSKTSQADKTRDESRKSKTSQADKTRDESSESKAQQADKTKIESTKSKTSQADKTKIESTKSKTSQADKTRDESSESKAQQADKTKIESTKSKTSQADKTTRAESSESKAQQANKITSQDKANSESHAAKPSTSSANINGGDSVSQKSSTTTSDPPNVPLEKINVNMKVVARRKALSWHAGKVAEIVTKDDGRVKYKVAFEEKGRALVSGHHIALAHQPKVSYLSTGARVVIESEDGEFMPGFVAEVPGRKNHMRFMVFTDDHTPVYIALPKIRLVCQPLADPLDDIPDKNHRDFMRHYLRQMPFPPQTHYRVGQKMRALYNGTQEKVEVLQVDCSLIEVIFEVDQHKEWLYRGSVRLEQMVQMYEEMEAKYNDEKKNDGTVKK